MAEDTKTNHQYSGMQCSCTEPEWLSLTVERTRRLKNWERQVRLETELTLPLSDKLSRVTDAQQEESCTSCVCASHCLLSLQRNEWRRLPASSCSRLPGPAERQNNEEERRACYSKGWGKEGDKRSNTHRVKHAAVCKHRHRYRCIWGHTPRLNKHSEHK